MKNSKGFSLIEILVVIALISAFVLIGYPIVKGILDNSNKESFRNTTIGIISDFDKAYNEKKDKEVLSTESICSNSKVYSFKTSDEIEYSYLCMTLNDLRKEEYIKNKLDNDYGGYIQIWVNQSNGEAITFINVTNGDYYIQGRVNDLTNKDFKATKESYDGNEIQKPSKSIVCPENCLTIPSSNITNIK